MNVVGYAQSGLNDSGATLTAAMFTDVAETDGSIKLGSIKPMLSSGSVAGEYGVEIQFLNDDGSTNYDQEYFWDGTKWIDVMNGDADSTNVKIPAGKGLWTYNYTGETCGFQSSGEVGKKDILFALNDSGATAVANAFPCPTTYGEVTPIPNPGEYGAEIQYLNDDGSTNYDQEYFWDGTKWIDVMNGDADATNVSIPAGKGLWTYNYSGAACGIQITAPEL